MAGDRADRGCPGEAHVLNPIAVLRRSRRVGDVTSALAAVVRREWPLIGIGLAALLLRSHQLLDQVPIDDEWHALGQAMTHRMSDILTQFGRNDISIPIAVYYKVLILTIGLTTWSLRLPFLLFGVAIVVGLPLMVRPVIGRAAGNVLAALMSVSTILIFFSRYARPYVIALFCALGAALAFRAWWDSGRRRWAVSYVALAAFACWLVVIVAPFVLGSFVLFGVAAIATPGGRLASLGRLARLGFATLLTFAVLLGPPLWFDGRSLLSKTNAAPIRPADLYGAAVYSLANGGAALAMGIAALAAIGMVVLSLRDSTFVRHLVGLAALQLLGFVVAKPYSGGFDTVSSRYLLPVLGVTLVFSAVGIVAVFDRFGATVAVWIRSVFTVAVCGILLWRSPVPLIGRRPNNWSSQYLGRSLDWYAGYVHNIRAVPPFYETLALQPPGSTPIVEVPSNEFTFRNPLPFYQRIHRQPVLIGMRNGVFDPPVFGEVPYGHPGIDLRTSVFVSDIETMRRRGARYVIVHRDLYGETRNPPDWTLKSADMRPCIEWLRTKLGEPVVEGPSIVVFRL
jgi:hypothetical protein